MSSRSTYLSIFRNWRFNDSFLPSAEEFGSLLRAQPQSCDRPLRVAIVGAGTAGLTAALILEKFGHQPSIIEADTRIGGRIHTLRNVFDSPLIAEAGAARVRDDHFWTVAMCDELDLELVPFYPAQATIVRADEHKIERQIGQFEPYEIHSAVTTPVPESGSDQPYSNVHQCISNRITGEHWLRIKGGFDCLPDALAKRVTIPIRTGSVVTSISDRNTLVALRIEEDGRSSEETFDCVICTVPAAVLSNIAFDPPLPTSHLEIFDQLEYAPANRLFVLYHRRPDMAPTDVLFGRSSRLGEVWQVCHDQEAPHCLLASCLFGQKARRRADDYPGSVSSAVVEMSDLGGFAVGDVLQTHWFSWDDQPFIRGAHPRVWDLVDVDFHAARIPHGRIHFAGEHTSSTRGLGWIDGAIESGVREALNVHYQSLSK